MPDSLFTYALFIIPLFIIGACLLTGLPVAVSIQDYYKSRGRQTEEGPGPNEAASAESDWHDVAAVEELVLTGDGRRS
jgi:hypothetical protein